MKLEEKLISLRKANGLSQLKLAEKMGVSRQAISKWGAGASKPSTENLKTLAALYDVPLEYLLNEDDPGPAHVERRTGENTEVGPQKAKMVRTDAGRDRDHGSNPLFHVFSGQERESCFNE